MTNQSLNEIRYALRREFAALITPEVHELIGSGAQFFVGHSGGKDSQAMFAILSAFIPADQLHVTHADLGDIEHANVKDFINQNIDGKTLHVAQAIHADGSRKDFFSATRARRITLDTPSAKHPEARRNAPAFPDNVNRFCTSDLKTDPIWKVIRNHGRHPIVVNCVGIRAQESKKRAKKIAERGTFNVNKKNTNGRRQAFDWWPIADLLIDQVWRAIELKGQARHPAYDNGNDRLSCVFCIFGSRGDLARGKEQRPELFKKYADLERDVRGTMFNGATLAQRINSITNFSNAPTIRPTHKGENHER